MKRVRRWTKLGALVGLAGSSAAACDAVAERSPFVAEEVSDGSAPVEASLPPDGGPAVDAGTTLDASDVTVACAVIPCAVEITAGNKHFCARMSDGTVRCWGDTSRGTIGQTARDLDAGDAGDASNDADAAVPDPDFALEPLVGIEGAKELRAGGGTTCVVDGAGKVLCWGYNDWGQLGLSATTRTDDDNAHPSPTPVDLSGPANRLSLGQLDGCAFVGAEVHCWGANQYRQLSRDSTIEVGGPGATRLDAASIERVAVSEFNGFALTKDANILSWGAMRAQAGRAASLANDPTPELVRTISGVTDIAAWGQRDVSRYFGQVCAVANHKFYCWGDNEKGTLCSGIPDPEPGALEIEVPDNAIPSQVAVSENLTCVRSTNGKVHCCGEGNRGQMGTDPPDAKASAKQVQLTHVSSLEGVAAQVATSASSVCALLQDGSVECWGSNAAGELGQGTRDNGSHSTPVKVRFR